MQNHCKVASLRNDPRMYSSRNSTKQIETPTLVNDI